MLKYVKEGALDLLAFTLPSSLIESIRQVSDDDFLSPNWGHQQRQPRMRRRHNATGTSTSSRAVAPTQRHLLTTKKSSGELLSSAGSMLLQDADARSHDLPDSVSSNCLNKGPQLPYEVLTLIFQYLPASDMFSILAVNRIWRQIALMETKQIDLSECFPMDCLGLGDEDFYSDFDFVYHLFSIFPLISSLVIKDRYMRDRDLRVVTAGILAGKMAFTETVGPTIESETYLAAQQAIAQRRAQQQQAGTTTATTTTTPSKPTSPKVIRATIKEELREFSRSVATYVLIPQTRNTLRKKILERLEYNLEQKEIQEYCWMVENGIDPLISQSSTAAALTQWRAASSLSSSNASTSTAAHALDAKRYPLVPMTHYRFQDCCFAKDWGSAMDINKLPMIGLAAAISGQGLVVDLEGSYGAPSKSIKQMIAFCFGAHCVISLDLNFRHTHMELEHVTELLSENPMLHKIDIVDSPAYHDLIRLPALRGLGEMMERMQKLCFDLDEQGLEAILQQVNVLLRALDKDIELEEAERADRKTRPVHPSGSTDATLAADEVPPEPVPAFLMAQRRPMNDIRQPVESLTQQLSFAEDALPADKLRTAKVLLKGVIYHGVSGLVNTRDRQSGQALLHTLAWRRSYSVLAALATQPASVSPSTELSTTPATHEQQSSSLFSSSPSSSSMFSSKGYFWNQGPGLFSSSAPSSSTLSENLPDTLTNYLDPSGTVSADTPATSFSLESSTSTPAAAPSQSGLSSLINISSLPAALSSALSFRRMSLPVSTLWIPGDSEDIGVGEGTQPESDYDDDEDQDDSGVDMSRVSRSSSPEGSVNLDQPDSSDNEAASTNVSLTPAAAAAAAASVSASASAEPAKKVWVIPEQHPVAVSLRMARMLLGLKANPNVYNKDGRSAVVCASYMGFQPMETLLIEQGGYLKELIRIRETM
ncbi:hypothetical protein BGZ95_004475 [Linnemannia exigua]|uniref:F-box domain-containing protein n=1 Tax=Linnemannia exigua TaxID=604196 RepID=A0AAD4H243_9FUNG|nr:hypothetical protein BGZ95_004475 [Linnemannia exigua]